MRALLLIAALAACTDDGVTIDNANDRVTCEPGDYTYNDVPVKDCARACQARPEADVVLCKTELGWPLEIDGVVGACVSSGEPGESPRVDWMPCE